MKKIGKVINGLLELAGIASDEDVRRMVLGEYSNGNPRSIPDAIRGEYLSPSEKHEIMYGKKQDNKKNKKRKKNKKGKKSKKKIDFQL